MRLNAYLRVWILNPNNHKRRYCMRTGVHRVMFEGGRARIMLKEVLTKNPQEESDLLTFFVEGCQIVLMHSEYGRPDDFDAGKAYLVFTNCRPLRAWMPHAVALNPDEASELVFYSEVISENWSWGNVE